MQATMNNPSRKAARRRTAGFTLVELLVVILIIMVLVAVLLPTISKVRTMVLCNKTQATINLIQGACEAYSRDLAVHAYPSAARFLVQGLTGIADNDDKPGYGWRRVPRGKVYGPYYGAEDLQVNSSGPVDWFVDAFDRPILYYVYESIGDGDPPPMGYKSSVAHDGPEDLQDYLKGPDGKYFRENYVLISRGPNGEWDPLYENGKWTRSDDITNLKIE
ncbi:hypothetical protein LCGC14_2947790 [marine sediment metagenome]|uniref:Type II secretion system protein GspG C-terminal domain-containing protein n=1 Tax=marine sediment metagenome TaxID=412755 RepID=A0A0F8Y3B1_9ZZZZ